MNSFLLIKPVITEKSLLMAQTMQMFTFEVARSATKDQIKQVVEKTYGVNVNSVNTTMRWGGQQATGKKRLKKVMPKVKKAIITLPKGQNIDVFDIQPGADNTQA